MTEYLEGAFSRQLESLLVETYLKEKAMFWPASLSSGRAPGRLPLVALPPGAAAVTAKTVEALMATPAQLFVRNSLPLEQVRRACCLLGVLVVVSTCCASGRCWVACGGLRDGSAAVLYVALWLAMSALPQWHGRTCAGQRL